MPAPLALAYLCAFLLARLSLSALRVIWLLYAVFCAGWLVAGAVIVLGVLPERFRIVAILSLCLQLAVATAFPIAASRNWQRWR